MNSNIQGYNIKLPIIPDAIQVMSKNPSAIKFTNKNEFDDFLKKQKYFNASYSHCYYSKEDYELSKKGDSRFMEKNTGVSESNRGCVLKKDSGDLVAIWDEKNQIGYIVPSTLQETTQKEEYTAKDLMYELEMYERERTKEEKISRLSNIEYVAKKFIGNEKNKINKDMKITLSEVKQIIKEEVDRYKKIKLLEAKKASIEKELNEFIKEIEEDEVGEGVGMSLTNKKGMSAKPNAPYLKYEEEMGEGVKKGKEKNEINYKGKTITKLFPSGYYEFRSDKEGKFLKFDDLKMAKKAIDKESGVEEGIEISKTIERGENKKPETPHKKERY